MGYITYYQQQNNRRYYSIVSKTACISCTRIRVFFQSFTIQIPNSIFIPLNQLANGFVAIALLLLGAQLSNIKLNFFHRVITWALIGRLLMGPLLALAVIYILNIDGIVAQSLFIASSFPTSEIHQPLLWNIK